MIFLLITGVLWYLSKRTFYIKVYLRHPNLTKYYKTEQLQYHSGDSGYDLYCPEKLEMKGNTYSEKYNLGVSIEAFTCYYLFGYRVPLTMQPSSFWLMPRSSIGKTALRLANSMGLIDSGYRGQLCAMVDNVQIYATTITEGSRLFQICHPELLKDIRVEYTNRLSETTRGEGGHGSTGV